jgi:tRNA threonylcarbamoyladenosine biosynthesis protein TsaE
VSDHAQDHERAVAVSERARVVSLQTASAAQTEALGARLAATLSGGDLVLLRGELGAGKTTLARGIARALGVRGPVTSPTFTVGQRYAGARLAVAHLDLYRIASLDDEEPGMLSDYLDDRSVALVEWPPEATRELPEASVVVTLEHRGADTRAVTLEDRRAAAHEHADVASRGRARAHDEASE